MVCESLSSEMSDMWSSCSVSAVRVIALACLVDVVIWTVDWTHLNMRDFEVERITTSTLQIEAHTESRIRTKHFIKTLNSKHTH